MSKVWKMPLYAAGMAAALVLVAGCNNNPPAGDGGEPTAPAPAGTNIPAGGAPGAPTGGPSGANIPGGNGPSSNGPSGH